MEANNRKIKILLVEDDPNLSLVLKDYLDMLGYQTTLCVDGKEGADKFEQGTFDMCILDIMMPKKDGITLAKEIRKESQVVPIIFLTAKNQKEDLISGFKSGCDDYITKPFSTEELKFRIEAILKRCLHLRVVEKSKDIFEFGVFRFDYPNQMLISPTKKQRLTRKENGLLRVLVMNINQLVTREYALNAVWGRDDYFIGRSMDVFISKLRKYLSEDSNINITNVHGTGFKLEISE